MTRVAAASGPSDQQLLLNQSVVGGSGGDGATGNGGSGGDAASSLTHDGSSEQVDIFVTATAGMGGQGGDAACPGEAPQAVGGK